MIGHKSIIQLRDRRYKPEIVSVYVHDGEPRYFPGTHPELSIQNGFLAEIAITPMDRCPLDFRCLTGLEIRLQGSLTAASDSRVLSVLRQIERASPKRVIAVLSDRIIDTAQLERAAA